MMLRYLNTDQTSGTLHFECVEGCQGYYDMPAGPQSNEFIEKARLIEEQEYFDAGSYETETKTS